MSSKDVKITYRFWAEMAKVDPAILWSHVNKDYDEGKMHGVMFSAAGQVINDNRIPMSVDDTILFCPDGRVIITEMPQD